MKTYTITFTEQEAAISLALMQIGVRSVQGPQFDEANAAYTHLRQVFHRGMNAVETINDNPAPAAEAVAS